MTGGAAGPWRISESSNDDPIIYTLQFLRHDGQLVPIASATQTELTQLMICCAHALEVESFEADQGAE